MSRYNPHFSNIAQTLEAAATWKDRCFVADGSLFSDQQLWTLDHTKEIKAHFNDNPDATKDPFLVKLRRQFDGASPQAKRLMAEMLWILNLFPCNIGASAKRNIVVQVWGWSGSELSKIHPLLSDEVLKGSGSGGPGYLAHRWRELRFLVNLILDFKARDPQARLQLLASPWLFAEWVNNIPDEGYRQFKLILPYLTFPDEFERISSPRDIRKILGHFAPDRNPKTMSNLESAKALLGIRKALEEQHGSTIDFYEDNIKPQWAPDDLDTVEAALPEGVTTADSEMPRVNDLNTILYGPPGTGKTYRTIDRALGIIDPDFHRKHFGDRDALKSRFDEYVDQGRIAFVTFHQSFSYEDFIEGIRAETGADGELRYCVADGIFKNFCNAAGWTRPSALQLPDSDYTIKQMTDEILWLQKPNGSQLPLPWAILNELCDLVDEKVITVEDIRAKRVFDRVPDSRLEKFIVNGYNNIIPNVVTAMLKNRRGRTVTGKRVLIIDEINRGNISRIFGELITLIEDTKREGASEALSVVLPYSKAKFSVPRDVYIIGTMNTADRSLATLDLALRRRFSFEEVEPDSALLQDIEIAGVNLGALLDRLNARIEVLLDRDHRIGHASLLNLVASESIDSLKNLFRSQILPLLQEYFFEDWQRIRLVLNDHQKDDVADCFIIKKGQDPRKLFGEVAGEIQASNQWEINWAALDRPSAYISTIGEEQ
jgi:5-methylcytosine-specific restriction protein B